MRGICSSRCNPCCGMQWLQGLLLGPPRLRPAVSPAHAHHRNASLRTLRRCRLLDLSCNRLACLLPLAGLPALRELNLQGNSISTIPHGGTAPSGFSCLEELDLSYNAISPQAFGFLMRLPRLRHLDVSGVLSSAVCCVPARAWGRRRQQASLQRSAQPAPRLQRA